MTPVEENRKAGTVVDCLSGQAEHIAGKWSLEVLKVPDDLSKLLEELDEKFSLEKVNLFHNTVSDFLDFLWDRKATVHQFVIGFHSRLEKASSLSLDEKLEGHILLRQASLDAYGRNVIIGSAGGKYSFQAITTALRNAFRTERLPAISMVTSGLK